VGPQIIHASHILSDVVLKSKSNYTPNKHLEQRLEVNGLAKLLEDKLMWLYVFYSSVRVESVVFFVVDHLTVYNALYDAKSSAHFHKTATRVQLRIPQVNHNVVYHARFKNLKGIKLFKICERAVAKDISLVNLTAKLRGKVTLCEVLLRALSQ